MATLPKALINRRYQIGRGVALRLRTQGTLRELFKTTIIGGASFLLPVAIVIFILSYALRLVRRIAEPISHSLHLDHLVGAGIGTVTVLSVAVLVLISFAAGIIARTGEVSDLPATLNIDQGRL
jgi:uncharacterized membrane protein